MTSGDSVVLLHDGPRVWLSQGDDGCLRAFRRPLPHADDPTDPDDDWERVFWFLPDEILIPVRATWAVAVLEAGSGGRPVRVSSFHTELPSAVPRAGGPLGRVVEARLGRVREYAAEGRVGDPETLVALFAVAHDRATGGRLSGS
ncbi:hypothetical protein SK069_12070 [Patulibacter brassicae]|uniref:Uncharacterized protein n=1 Tax=Patulibacter brassicae TaxID=1705717 RepID=A0ABU4VKG0_9ACTN|nr:hypothetical protein [Patulibacter brassicae]MDX8152336.1 hypothetical protein [Patulibacter brassicae]